MPILFYNTRGNDAILRHISRVRVRGGGGVDPALHVLLPMRRCVRCFIIDQYRIIIKLIKLKNVYVNDVVAAVADAELVDEEIEKSDASFCRR